MTKIDVITEEVFMYGVMALEMIRILSAALFLAIVVRKAGDTIFCFCYSLSCDSKGLIFD